MTTTTSMAPSLLLRLAPATFTTHFHGANYTKPTRISTQICRIGWKDPEGVLGAPQGGHIARLELKRRLEKDADAREAFERQIRQEKERRQALRDSRGVPNTAAELVEYFLDTEAREIEIEIARMRPRLNEEFFSHLKLEVGKLRFAVTKTQDVEDRLAELELLQKALKEGTEAYDKMQAELVTAKKSLAKIFTSQDVKKTLLEMVELNELNRSLLTLLDENIASAHNANQVRKCKYPCSAQTYPIEHKLLPTKNLTIILDWCDGPNEDTEKNLFLKEAAEYMTTLRKAVVKYITV